MFRRLLIPLLLFLACASWGQISNPSVTMKTFAGAPTGTCSARQLAVDTTTGNLYACNAGTWKLAGGSAGVTGSGTTNTVPKFTGSTAIGNSGLSDDGTSVTTARQILFPNGSSGAPSISFTNDSGSGFHITNAGTEELCFRNGGNNLGRDIFCIGADFSSPRTALSNDAVLGFTSGSQAGANTIDVGFSRSSTNVLQLGNGTLNDATGTLQLGTLSATRAVLSGIQTATNCSSTASPAVCGSASAGSFVIAAAATAVTVNTTAVNTSSQIFVQEDSSLGTKLGVTCNTGILANPPDITARVPSTSFSVGITVGLTVNPVCFSYFVVN